MKIAFCTCVQIGLSCMEAIYASGGSLDLILSIPDEKARKKSGRIYVDDFAQKHGIPVFKSNHINDEAVKEELKERGIDWLIIIGWSQIASKEVISVPTFGTIGAHPTLLPEGRGRAAIPWAILKGLPQTGVSFFKMDEGVDTGEILGQEMVPIAPNETATVLYEKVNHAHETLIQKIFPLLKQGEIRGTVQDESKASYWEGRRPEDGQLFPSMNVEEVDRLVRATTRPYPGAFWMDGSKKAIVWSGTVGNHGPNAISFANGFYTPTELEWVEEEVPAP